ncbi:uncharacterized protein Dwil_GK15927 [Drosophila willistoni]|uniref:Uncharacterized protein n=1 Tax=Drosophila willistoni TaxID=7260 RepID=B4MS11_DROWI|nr:uncharacterized protein LOC6640858 [Drosophila willistoni]EDW74900.1 uncharacterized protein Dwil_GK15927 [Drosophila willistoni]
MPVAVRLIEALALITVMGLITCVSLSVIVAQRTINVAISCIQPAANIASVFLLMTEKVLVGALNCVVGMINVVSNALHGTGVA